MDPEKLEENWRNPDGTLKEGHPPMGGRPKGKTLKEFAREMLMTMPDEEKVEFLKTLPKDIVWRMAEGNPHQTGETDLNLIIPKPIDDVFKDESIQEDKETEEEN